MLSSVLDVKVKVKKWPSFERVSELSTIDDCRPGAELRCSTRRFVVARCVAQQQPTTEADGLQQACRVPPGPPMPGPGCANPSGQSETSPDAMLSQSRRELSLRAQKNAQQEAARAGVKIGLGGLWWVLVPLIYLKQLQTPKQESVVG